MNRVALLVMLVMLLNGTRAVAQSLPEPTLEQARTLYDAKKLDEARIVLERLKQSGSRDPEVFLLAGVVDRTAGRLGPAIESLEQGLALAPDSRRMRLELATTLAWNRELDRAIALFRQVLSAYPEDVGALSGLGFALAWQGRLDEARAIFTPMTDDAAAGVVAWNGLGFVERASFDTAAAEAAYRRALAIDPDNADALAALEALPWDWRGDSRVYGGVSDNPGASTRGEARLQTMRLMNPRVTLSGGYQHYAFGATTVGTGGGVLVGTRAEDALEAGVIVRPSSRTLVATSVTTIFNEDSTRGIVWVEGAFTVLPRVTLTANVRPAFSTVEPGQLWAWALGGSVAIARQHRVSGRALVGTDTEYEPRLTALVNYEAVLSRRLTTSVGVEWSRSDPRYEFTAVYVRGSYMFTPRFGLAADASRRTGTAERSTLLAGIILRY